jgi:hypothetical protein
MWQLQKNVVDVKGSQMAAVNARSGSEGLQGSDNTELMVGA